MNQQTVPSLSEQYELDETAWLDAMAELIDQGRFDDLDYAHLKEYLEDMARRDRREVKNRLTVLISHLLKWQHQPEGRSKSWRRTILIQRQALADQIDHGVLRQHAQMILSEAYKRAVELAAVESGLPVERFMVECPYELDQLMSAELSGDE